MKNFIGMYLSLICLSVSSFLPAQATNFKKESGKNKSEIKKFKIQISYPRGNSLVIDSTSISIKEQQPEFAIGKTEPSYAYELKDSLNLSTPVSIVPNKPVNKTEQAVEEGSETLNLDTSKTINIDNNRDANRGKNIDNNRDKNRDRNRDVKRDKNRDRDSSKDKGSNIYIKIKIKNNRISCLCPTSVYNIKYVKDSFLANIEFLESNLM